MALSTRVTICYQDRYGFKWCIGFHVDNTVVDPDDAKIVAVIAAINILTRAVNITVELSKVNAPAGAATSLASYVNEDKGFFRFTDEDGSPHSYKIPSLVPGILDANTESITSSNVLVLAYTNAVKTYAQGRGSASIQVFVSAYRKENRKLLKR